MHKKRAAKVAYLLLFFVVAIVLFAFFRNRIFADVSYPETKIFVAPSGDDLNTGVYPVVQTDGSKSGPVKTLNRAREILRQKKQSNPAQKYTISLREGSYLQSELFSLTSADSGPSVANPTTIESYPGEIATIVGADRRSLNWQACGSECPSEGTYKARLEGEADFNSLFVNGSRAQRARTPNDIGSYTQRHYFFGEKAVDQIYSSSGSKDLTNPVCSSYIYYQSGQVNPSWRNLDKVEVVSRTLYLDYHDSISSIDPLNKKVFFAPRTQGAAYGKKYCFDNDLNAKSNRFYVENVFEALDLPGEYYFDNNSKWLYYLPRDGEVVNNLDVRIPQSNSLFEIGSSESGARETSNIEIKNIEFSYTDRDVNPSEVKASKPAVGIYNSVNVKFINNSVSNVAGPGVYIDSKSKNVLIKSNKISFTGLDGVKVSKPGEEIIKNNVESGVYIENNIVSDVGLDSAMFTHPISLFSAGYAKVSHNKIYNAPYSGISKQQSADIEISSRYRIDIEYNEIYNVLQKLNDGGGIHVCSKFDQSAYIRNNYVHDIGSTNWNIPDKNDLSGIYYDCSSMPTNAYSFNNLIKKVPLGITVINQGANKIYNNILVDVPGNNAMGPISLGLCCSTNYACAKDKSGYGFDNLPNYFYRNIFYYNLNPTDSNNPTRPLYFNSDCAVGLEKVMFAKMIAQRDYNLYFDYSGKDTTNPSVFVNNGGPQSRAWSWLENVWKTNGIDNLENHSVFSDPQFEDVSTGDYRLKPSSPAISLIGFEPFNFKEAGAFGSIGPEAQKDVSAAQSPLSSSIANSKIVTFPHGFSVFGNTKEVSGDFFAQNGLYLYKFDGPNNKWLLYPGSASFNASQFYGYYVYNPTSAKTISVPTDLVVANLYKVSKGWNLLWSVNEKSKSQIQLEIDGQIKPLEQWSSDNRIFSNVYVIANESASQSCEYFKLLSDTQISTNCSSGQIGSISKLPSGKAFWIYVY